MSDYTNAKTIKPGVYLIQVSPALFYYRCNCGHESGHMPKDMATKAGRQHVCILTKDDPR